MGLEYNFNSLKRKLGTLEKKVSEKTIETALNKGADIALEAQRQTVPEGDTGKLKDSLDKSKARGSNTNKKINVGIQNAHEREVVYGYYQEHGTRRMPGKRWMSRAWEDSKKEAKKAIKESLQKDLKL